MSNLHNNIGQIGTVSFLSNPVDMSVLLALNLIDFPTKDTTVFNAKTFPLVEPDYTRVLFYCKGASRMKLFYEQIMEKLKLNPDAFDLYPLFTNVTKFNEFEYFMYSFKAAATCGLASEIHFLHIFVEWLEGMRDVQNSKRVQSR